MIDKIIAPIILIMTVTFFGIILYMTVFTGIQADLTLTRQRYETEYGETLIGSVFLAQENESGMSYEGLLARSLQELNTTVLVNGRAVDVRREYQDALDALLGPDAYYLEVKPLLRGVAVSYVLDGSETMAPKRAQVNAALPTLYSSLRTLFGENATVLLRVYMLQQDADQRLCSNFYTAPGISCEEIGGDALYRALRAKAISPPAPLPYRTYSEWIGSTHEATAYHLSQSDWASGAMYASNKHADDLEAQVRTNRHVIVTVADELATTSKADECFGIRAGTDHPEEIAENDLLFCYLCNATCPLERSTRIVNQTKELLAEHRDLFIGFSSFPCDYEYNTRLNTFAVSNYSCRYLDSAQSVCAQVTNTTFPAANANWCEQRACGGCVPSSPRTAYYCFHRNCDDLILTHLEMIANATGGQRLALTGLSQLTDVVMERFERLVGDYNFTIGVRDTTRDRYVHQEEIAFPDGERVKVDLWIYDQEQ